ncbi:hypothetical protein MPTK1_2g26530 [Marchantia polymorpha subsp. ruderalis]|uniref:Uncharacterized protein n=1 Tax=Marchantia polymorpha TaxID=3197 RepID=A0A2R6XB49_MARPO|nr:hypothetical protein MARPO_0025s0031 [Marchantia polymorpha]BBN03799.1 hypothetical protein Mp_2g26530 [Marchantia polymorpha subsp. ruderalis]|eukprot:PTQ43336.1 hypothetical protein MARPO_0025s0031 [Marchantia polymorpha]
MSRTRIQITAAKLKFRPSDRASSGDPYGSKPAGVDRDSAGRRREAEERGGEPRAGGYIWCPTEGWPCFLVWDAFLSSGSGSAATCSTNASEDSRTETCLPACLPESRSSARSAALTFKCVSFRASPGSAHGKNQIQMVDPAILLGPSSDTLQSPVESRNGELGPRNKRNLGWTESRFLHAANHFM